MKHAIVSTGLRKIALILLAAAFLPAFTGSLGAQSLGDEKTIVAPGFSRIYGNVGDAKNAAIAESIRFAVHTSASEMLSERQITEAFETISAELLSNPNRFIQDYRIVKEFQADRSYRVLVRATVLSGEIEKALAAAGVQTRPEEMPSVLFMVAERHAGEHDYTYWWEGQGDARAPGTAAFAMTGIMTEKGFTVINPRRVMGNLEPYKQGIAPGATPADSEAAVFGRRMGAHLVILGTAESLEGRNRMGEDGRTYEGRVDLRVIDTRTGRALTSARRNMVSIGPDRETTARNAMADAAYQAGMQLAPRIEALWQGEEIPEGGTALSVSGENILSSLEALRRTVSGMDGVSDVRTMRLSPGTVELWVDFRGSADELADGLLRQSYGPFGIHIEQVAEESIEIELLRELRSEPLSE